jgi:putative addiction module killer protein
LQIKPKKLVEYVDPAGVIPFRRWFGALRDSKIQAIIDARLTRLRLGNLGLCRSVGGGVIELKIDYGPGYRVYLGQDGDTVVVLLIGGDKKSQAADIKRAKQYWDDYRRA